MPTTREIYAALDHLDQLARMARAACAYRPDAAHPASIADAERAIALALVALLDRPAAHPEPAQLPLPLAA